MMNEGADLTILYPFLPDLRPVHLDYSSYFCLIIGD